MDPNQMGEILISSPYLATGYLNKPDQTSEDFIFEEDKGIIKFRSKDLGYKQSDGCIIHMGRSDSMVKIRGYRVDLGEIENNLIQHKTVKEASVLLKENPFGTKHIVAYVVAKDDSSIDFEYLKMGILRMLPEYMVPSYFVQLESLPRNEIGKLDKKAIPDPDWNRFDEGKVIIQPKNAIEYELQEIFQRILEVQPISMDDNILDLGADSLRLFVAFDEIEKNYGKKLNIDSFIENPTLAHLAKVVA
jgi:long-subunit acyl-CoA synthetase (AMP-forming)